MTRLGCAIELLRLLCKFASDNGVVAMEKIEAVARAIMELGRSEGAGEKSEDWRGEIF
mgnify:CR=1 FL=1